MKFTTGRQNSSTGVSKYKYIKLVFIVTVFIFLISQSVLALELKYPPIPGYGQGLDNNFNLPEYIKYVFQFLIVTSGTIGIILVAVSGFKVLLAFGSPEKLGQAWGNIRSIILGILLLMTSFIILNTINYELVNPSRKDLPFNTSIYFRWEENGELKYRAAPKVVSDIREENLPSSNVELYYYCDNKLSGNILVWTYKAINKTVILQPFDSQNTFRLSCGGYVPLADYLSYVINPEIPGVYFYRTGDCSGFSSEVHNSRGEIVYPYKNAPSSMIRSMRIVNGFNLDEKYGVILNSSYDGSGECSDPTLRPFTDEGCVTEADFPRSFSLRKSNVELFSASYAYIMNYDINAIPPLIPPSPNSPPLTSGSVDFKSDNLFARFLPAGSKGNNGPATEYDIGPMLLYNKNNNGGHDEAVNPDKFIRNAYFNKINEVGPWRGTQPREAECCTIYSDKKDIECCVEVDEQTQECSSLLRKVDPGGVCFNRVDVNGSYYVAIYAENQATGERTCAVLTSGRNDVNNLLSDNARKFYKVSIIPRYGN